MHAACVSLSLSLFSLSGALPCWCRDGGMGFWGGAAKVRSRVVDVEVLDFNDSPTGGGLLPAPGGDTRPVQVTQKQSNLLVEVAEK